MEVTVLDRQSVLDIAVQALGGIEGVFALAERNGISITDRMEDGTVLEYDVSDIVDGTVQTFYANRSLQSATEITDEELNALLGIVTDEGDSGDTGSDTRIFTDEYDEQFE